MSYNIFKKLLRFSRILPKSIKHALLRETLSLPWDLDIGVQFKFVTDQSEFMDAIRILHNAYVEKSYMNEDPLKVRLTPYHLMPSTLMAVAKFNGNVVATMSLIRDNPLGLPMEKSFDLSPLRTKGEVLGEFSALAISPEYRGQGGALLHSFFRFFYRYIKTWCGVDHLVVAVNPSMAELYEAFYLFQSLKSLAPSASYDFANGAPAVPLFFNLNEFDLNYKKVYLKKTLKKNLFHFLQSSNATSDLYPWHEYFQVKSTILGPNFVRSLRKEIPDLDNRFTEIEKLRIAQGFGAKSFSEIGIQKSGQAPRIQMNTSTRIYLEGAAVQSLARVCDVSIDGIKLFVGAQQKIKSGNQLIRVRLGPNVFSEVVLRPVWQNDQGYAGAQLIETDQEWKRFINKLGVQSGFDRFTELSMPESA